MSNWERKNEWRPMFRQSEVETDEGNTEVMVEVGKYETANGVKSYSSAIEYDDTNNEELYYQDDDGNYIAVD